MPFYGFKPSPRQLVINKAKRLFGEGVNVGVTGTRPSALDCKRLNIPSGMYYVECFIDEKFVACAHSRNWRKAYKSLVVMIERSVEDPILCK